MTPLTVQKRLIILFSSLFVLACLLLAGYHTNRCIQVSRMVTQSGIAVGWKSAGFEILEHRIAQRENFWKVAREYHVDIDTIVGANPGLEKLAASLGQAIRVPNRKGVVHRTGEGETLQSIAALYGIPDSDIALMNNLVPKHILVPNLDLFIPKAKPVRLTDELASQYSLRGIFSSPLPGGITSGMGMRTHPVGGFRGRHTGIDLRAKEGTRIAAAAEGTVLQTGEGENIGRFIIIGHRDGYTTVYGHCSEILTAAGRTVKKGEIIAKSGKTGRTTGPHLHFEIRKNGVPQNPLNYLW
ncbi:MAG TPA: M23 family metallopeptidase [Nitrospirota bacterium]|nr:M23 family metallopeptidase [Nitrospirota bacterium]